MHQAGCLQNLQTRARVSGMDLGIETQLDYPAAILLAM